MDSCCNTKTKELEGLVQKRASVLKVVLGINLGMFFVEGYFGFAAGATSLLADSLDMLGDAFVYGLSLYAVGKSSRWGSSVSLVKGSVMLTFGLFVLGDVIRRFLLAGTPAAFTMGVVGSLAMAANVVCAVLLLRFRNDDLNMRSTWLCSRNDVIANAGVLLAALGVHLTNSQYPDLIVGVAISFLVLRSAVQVLIDAFRELRSETDHASVQQ